jgi:hypothetical protein
MKFLIALIVLVSLLASISAKPYVPSNPKAGDGVVNHVWVTQAGTGRGYSVAISANQYSHQIDLKIHADLDALWSKKGGVVVHVNQANHGAGAFGFSAYCPLSIYESIHDASGSVSSQQQMKYDNGGKLFYYHLVRNARTNVLHVEVECEGSGWNQFNVKLIDKKGAPMKKFFKS